LIGGGVGKVAPENKRNIPRVHKNAPGKLVRRLKEPQGRKVKF
jgi:hypothetical protein